MKKPKTDSVPEFSKSRFKETENISQSDSGKLSDEQKKKILNADKSTKGHEKGKNEYNAQNLKFDHFLSSIGGNLRLSLWMRTCSMTTKNCCSGTCSSSSIRPCDRDESMSSLMMSLAMLSRLERSIVKGSRPESTDTNHYITVDAAL